MIIVIFGFFGRFLVQWRVYQPEDLAGEGAVFSTSIWRDLNAASSVQAYVVLQAV